MIPRQQRRRLSEKVRTAPTRLSPYAGDPPPDASVMRPRHAAVGEVARHNKKLRRGVIVEGAAWMCLGIAMAFSIARPDIDVSSDPARADTVGIDVTTIESPRIPDIVRERAAATLALRSTTGQGTGLRVTSELVLYPSLMIPAKQDGSLCGSVVVTSGETPEQRVKVRTVGTWNYTLQDMAATSVGQVLPNQGDVFPLADSVPVPLRSETVFAVTRTISGDGATEPVIHPAIVINRAQQHAVLVLSADGEDKPGRALSGDSLPTDGLAGAAILRSDGSLLGMMVHDRGVSSADLGDAIGVPVRHAPQGVHVGTVQPVWRQSVNDILAYGAANAEARLGSCE